MPVFYKIDKERRLVLSSGSGGNRLFCAMYGILRELAGETGIRIFRTLEEALDWVLSKSTNA